MLSNYCHPIRQALICQWSWDTVTGLTACSQRTRTSFRFPASVWASPPLIGACTVHGQLTVALWQWNSPPRERLKTRGQFAPLINTSAPPLQDGRNGRLSSFTISRFSCIRQPRAAAALAAGAFLSHHYAYFSATKERSQSRRWKTRQSMWHW